MYEGDWLYKKPPSIEWKEMKVLVTEDIHMRTLRAAEAHGVPASAVVYRALEWWFRFGEIKKLERVSGGRQPRSSAELGYLMLGVLAEGGQWRRIRVLERLGLIGTSTMAKNATRRLVRMGWVRRLRRGVLEITREGREELRRQRNKTP